MDIKKSFASSPAEQSGVWFSEGDARFKVASFNSPDYRARLEELMEPHQREVRRKKFSRQARDEVIARAMADHVLVNWENVTDGGKAIPYSRDAALDLMLRYPKFFDLIKGWAADEAAFQEQEDSDGVANLKNG